MLYVLWSLLGYELVAQFINLDCKLLQGFLWTLSENPEVSGLNVQFYEWDGAKEFENESLRSLMGSLCVCDHT